MLELQRVDGGYLGELMAVSGCKLARRVSGVVDRAKGGCARPSDAAGAGAVNFAAHAMVSDVEAAAGRAAAVVVEVEVWSWEVESKDRGWKWKL